MKKWLPSTVVLVAKALYTYNSLKPVLAVKFRMAESTSSRIQQLLATNDFAQASKEVKAVADELLKRGEDSSLLTWIHKIPAEIRATDYDLSLIFAQSLIHTGELHQAGGILTETINRCSGDDKSLQVMANALIWRSATHRLAGNLDNAIADAETALTQLHNSDTNLTLVANAQFRLGNALLDVGDLNKSIEHLKLAVKSSANYFDLDLIARIQQSLGAAYLRRGNMTTAAIHFEYAREGWGKTGNSGALAATMNSLAYLYQRLGEPKRALDMLSAALSQAQSAGSKRIEASILIAIGVVQRDLDEFDRSVVTLKSSLTVARDAMEKNFVSWARAELGDTYRRMGQYSLSVQTLTEAVAQATEQSQGVEIEIFNVLLGISKFMGGDQNGGMNLLSTTAQRLESGGDQDALARCYFFLACCYFTIKDFENTSIWLGKTLSLADKLGYHEFLATDGEDFQLLIHFAASKHIGGDRFVNVQKRINEKLRAKRSKAITDGGEISPPGVEAYSFGDAKVWVFSKSVEENEWRSLRAKELFFYLLCHPRQTAEQITASLWPELTPNRALSNFHTNLFRARRATSPGIIIMSGGRYRINEDLVVYFDVFDFFSLTAPRQPIETQAIYLERLEHAVNLYRGPFLDGFQGEWIQELRQGYEARYLGLLSTLALHYRGLGQFQKAISLLEKAVSIDFYQDDLYCDIIECHIAQGDRLSALRVYQQYDSTVLKEMDSEPPPRLKRILKPLSI